MNWQGGSHLDWGIWFEWQSSQFHDRNVKMVYAQVRRLAYVDEFDLNSMFFWVFPEYGWKNHIWEKYWHLGFVGNWKGDDRKWKLQKSISCSNICYFRGRDLRNDFNLKLCLKPLRSISFLFWRQLLDILSQLLEWKYSSLWKIYP